MTKNCWNFLLLTPAELYVELNNSSWLNDVLPVHVEGTQIKPNEPVSYLDDVTSLFVSPQIKVTIVNYARRWRLGALTSEPKTISNNARESLYTYVLYFSSQETVYEIISNRLTLVTSQYDGCLILPMQMMTPIELHTFGYRKVGCMLFLEEGWWPLSCVIEI